MTDNYIIIEGFKLDDAAIILTDFSKLYAENEAVQGMRVYLQHNSMDKFLILFKNQPDFDHFSFLVNYLKYPADHDSAGSLITGFYQTKDIKSTHEFKTGNWVQVYVSKNDREFDNVAIVNNKNETYQYGFDGKIKKMDVTEERYQVINTDLSGYSLVKEITGYNAADKKTAAVSTKRPWWKIW
jgi:hypothetical protein